MGNTKSCVGQSNTNEPSLERHTLQNLLKWFEKVDTDSDYIKVPKTEFKSYRNYIKDVLNSTDKNACLDETKSRSQMNETDSRRMSLQILNNRSTTPATLFVKQLQYELHETHHINATTIDTLDEVKPEDSEVLVIVCNREEFRSLSSAVENCLKSIAGTLYRKIILIVLHVTRQDKLPTLSSRGEVKSNTIYSDIGSIVDMGFEDKTIYSCKVNDSAFTEITKFCSEYGSQSTNIVPDSDESKRRPTSVYIIDPSNANAVKCFIEALNEKLKKTGIVLRQKQIHDAKHLDQDRCLILLCNASSRIESDIEASLASNIHEHVYSRKKILIVLHVVRKGQEPKEYTKKKLEHSARPDKYSSFHSVIDMAFTEDEMIYECPMNDKAFTDLEHIFYDFSTTKIEAQEYAMGVNSADANDDIVSQPNEAKVF